LNTTVEHYGTFDSPDGDG